MDFGEIVKAERPLAARNLDLEQMRRGTRCSVSAQDLIRDYLIILNGDCFDAKIERPCDTRRIDAGFDEAQIFIEYAVLQLDRKGEDAIEPALDRRQFAEQSTIFGFDLKTRQFLKAVEADRFKLALVEQVEPADECLFCVNALEIVGRVEQILPTCLALTTRERAKTVEAASYRRNEAPFTPNIGFVPKLK